MAWRGRSGFTLVELLVVVAIIGVLAALVTPAIFQARVSAQNAAIRAEIDLLHMGMMNYKNQFGSYPPCLSNCNPRPPMASPPGKSIGDQAARMHLSRLFPRCSSSQTPSPPTAQDQFFVRLGDGPGWEGNDIDDDKDGDTDEFDENYYNEISPLDSLIFWLSGYSSNPANPLTGGTKEALYDKDDSRMDAQTGGYYPAGKPNAPFIYIDASNYGTTFTHSDIGTPVANRVRGIPGGPYSSVPRTPGGTDWHNPGKFQILNAGLDEQWGTDDDLSNFWKGTRGDQE
jgi:prepilin-type N-terminal cleavage/methylation domain-containing protein